MPIPDFLSLIRSARAGDREAMSRLLQFTEPYLQFLVRSYADSTGDGSGSDLKQEVAMQVWLKLGQFQGGSNAEQTLLAYRAWLRQTVHRQAMRRKRDRTRQRRNPPRPLVSLECGLDSTAPRHFDVAARDPTPRATAEAREDAAAIRAAIDACDTMDRRIIHERFTENRSLREIAERLELSYDAVRDRFAQTLRNLERQLNR